MEQKPITLWAVGRVFSDIEPREFVRVTEKSAFSIHGGREIREARHQEYLHLFDTESEAIRFVRNRLELKLANAKSAVEWAEKALGKFTHVYGASQATSADVAPQAEKEA